MFTLLILLVRVVGRYFICVLINDICSVRSLQLLFVGTRGDEYSGDIAIDDLKVSTGACR